MSENATQESGVDTNAGSTTGNDSLAGSVGNDTITLGSGTDSVNGRDTSGDTISSGSGLDAIVSAQLTALDASNPAPLPAPPVIQQVIVPEAVPLLVSVNAPDGSRHAIAVDASGTRISTDKSLCEAVRDAALSLRPTCAAVIEFVDDETKAAYGL